MTGAAIVTHGIGRAGFKGVVCCQQVYLACTAKLMTVALGGLSCGGVG